MQRYVDLVDLENAEKSTILQMHVLLSSVSTDETCKISENRSEMAREDTEG